MYIFTNKSLKCKKTKKYKAFWSENKAVKNII